MTNQIAEYLEKIIPAHDKLKHSFLGDTAYASLLIFSYILFLCFNFLTPVWLVSLIVLGISGWWEYEQKKGGGTNSKEEIFWDLFWGNVKHLAVTVCWILLN